MSFWKISNVENIFKDNNVEYFIKLLEKIKDISNFEPIIKLFNIKYIEEKDFF